MGLDNDTRGWIMSCVSGVACVLGSTIICADIFARYFGKSNFRIADSDVFLSSSMSLSAGVLLVTSLYSMLPTSKVYLIRAGYSPSAAAYILIGLFLLGVVVIKIVSGFIHHHIPSHVVSCAHSHAEDGREVDDASSTPQELTENTPLLINVEAAGPKDPQKQLREVSDTHTGTTQPHASLVSSILSGHIGGLAGVPKEVCDKNGPCYGVSQACGQECMKIVPQKDSESAPGSSRPMASQRHSFPGPVDRRLTPRGPTVQLIPDEDLSTSEAINPNALAGTPGSPEQCSSTTEVNDGHTHAHSAAHHPNLHTHKHHHHVPQNAFLSIGLQTSLAIALHKLPEGFITYATNHTNPTLGWSVFVALFIHNITEGFAMALPLYLALKSRVKAIIWSSLLGGVSQPAGAALAALWIWGSRRASGPEDTDGVSWAVYGGMFAATAGVMTNVALQLFSEGVVLSHNPNLCIGFAIAGMGILGVSFALTA